LVQHDGIWLVGSVQETLPSGDYTSPKDRRCFTTVATMSTSASPPSARELDGRPFWKIRKRLNCSLSMAVIKDKSWPPKIVKSLSPRRRDHSSVIGLLAVVSRGMSPSSSSRLNLSLSLIIITHTCSIYLSPPFSPSLSSILPFSTSATRCCSSSSPATVLDRSLALSSTSPSLRKIRSMFSRLMFEVSG
jgi:hypothetical protein